MNENSEKIELIFFKLKKKLNGSPVNKQWKYKSKKTWKCPSLENRTLILFITL